MNIKKSERASWSEGIAQAACQTGMDPSGKTKINEVVHLVVGSIFKSSSGFLSERERERELALWSGLQWDQPCHSSTDKVSRLRTGQPAAGADHSTPVSLSTDTTSQLFTSLKFPNNNNTPPPKKRKARRYQTEGSKAWRATAAPRSTKPLLPTRKHNG